VARSSDGGPHKLDFRSVHLLRRSAGRNENGSFGATPESAEVRHERLMFGIAAYAGIDWR